MYGTQTYGLYVSDLPLFDNRCDVGRVRALGGRGVSVLIQFRV
jgi:hypothetical protein